MRAALAVAGVCVAIGLVLGLVIARGIGTGLLFLLVTIGFGYVIGDAVFGRNESENRR